VQKLLHDANLVCSATTFCNIPGTTVNVQYGPTMIMGVVGANTLGDAVVGTGFGDGAPIAVWITPIFEVLIRTTSY